MKVPCVDIKKKEKSIENFNLKILLYNIIYNIGNIRYTILHYLKIIYLE